MTVPPTTRAPGGLPSEADVLGRMAGENFPVASALLGRRTRQHLIALYGWARLVDQLGDDYQGDRVAALDWADMELSRALAGDSDVHPLVGRAATMVNAVGADPALLSDLIEANRMDQVQGGCATFSDLLDYCRYSANPVGRIVLAIFGADSAERIAWSDHICTALQVTEHIQDIVEDATTGRVYLPRHDLERFGVDPAELLGDGPASPALRGLVCFEVARARRILVQGAPLVASLRGGPRIAVAGFVAGGHAALDAIAATGYGPLGVAPRPSPLRLAAHLLRTWVAATRRVSNTVPPLAQDTT